METERNASLAILHEPPDGRVGGKERRRRPGPLASARLQGLPFTLCLNTVCQLVLGLIAIVPGQAQPEILFKKVMPAIVPVHSLPRVLPMPPQQKG